MQPLIRLKSLILLSTLIVSALLLFPELADANKFETISRGVASGDKFNQLRFIGLIAGGFFAVSAIGLFFGRKKLSISPVAPIVFLVLGTFLASFWLLERL